MIIAVLAGIVAKGIGAVLAIFGIGVIVGVILVAAVMLRLRRGPRRPRRRRI